MFFILEILIIYMSIEGMKLLLVAIAKKVFSNDIFYYNFNYNVRFKVMILCFILAIYLVISLIYIFLIFFYYTGKFKKILYFSAPIVCIIPMSFFNKYVLSSNYIQIFAFILLILVYISIKGYKRWVR